MSIDSDFENLVQAITRGTPVVIDHEGNLLRMYGWFWGSSFSGYKFETPELALTNWIKTICDEHKLFCKTLAEEDAALAVIDTKNLGVLTEAEINTGDYVFASRWSDCDPNDRWTIGFVLEKTESKHYIVGNKDGSLIPGVQRIQFRHAEKITSELGDRLCQEMPKLEGSPTPDIGWKRHLGFPDNSENYSQPAE
jgi:hypothetical protein